MNRTDLSYYLFHWVKGQNQQEVFDCLLSIVINKKIYGSTKNIKGSYSCVCFTEAPIEHFNFDTSRYWPYGISVSKHYVFSLGGRPVIYQRDAEFYELPEQLRWKHVRYEPDLEHPIDFTWEREWRIQTQEFDLQPDEIKIIVPDKNIAETLESQFHQSEWNRYGLECVGYGEDLAQYPEPLIYSIKFIY